MDESLKKKVVASIQALHNDQPLDPLRAAEYKQMYVENLHKEGRDFVAELFNEIIYSAGGRQAYLFSGSIGSGKSTELRRLAYQLNNHHCAAYVLEIGDYLDYQQPASTAELLMSMALGAADLIHKESKSTPIKKYVNEKIEEMTALLTADIDIQGMSLKIPNTPLDLQLALKNSLPIKKVFSQHFEGRMEKIVAAVNKFMGELALKTPAEKKILIVDSMEHFGGKTVIGADKDEPLESLRKIFNVNSSRLRIEGWSIVYSVPPLLFKMAPGILANFSSASMYALASAHIFVDHSDTPDEKTIIGKMVPLVKKRLGGIHSQVISDEMIRKIIIQTGGDVRDLLRTLRAALLAGLANRTFPIDEAVLNRIFNDFKRPYLPLAEDVKKRLISIQQHKEPVLDSEEGWMMVMRDIAQKRVLLYLNDREWFDVHPLIRPELTRE